MLVLQKTRSSQSSGHDLAFFFFAFLFFFLFGYKYSGRQLASLSRAIFYKVARRPSYPCSCALSQEQISVSFLTSIMVTSFFLHVLPCREFRII